MLAPILISRAFYFEDGRPRYGSLSNAESFYAFSNLNNSTAEFMPQSDSVLVVRGASKGYESWIVCNYLIRDLGDLRTPSLIDD